MSEINAKRLDQAFDRLQAYPLRDSTLDQRFREWMLTTDDDSLLRINAYNLAAGWNVAEGAVLLWLIYASQVGIFDLHWEAHCSHCNAPTIITDHLGAIGHEAECKMCQVTGSVHSDENVEVRFTINPSIRAIQPSLQATMPPGAVAVGQWDTAQPITMKMEQPGEYFLVNLVAGRPVAMTRFDVIKEKTPIPEMKVTFYPESASPAFTELGPGTTTFTVEGIPHVFGVYRDNTQKLILRRRVTGLDVMMMPQFKDIFAHDTLSQRESLSVKSLTILFTDITGSTAMYKRLGDVRAYNLVRDHFDILFREIEKHSGLVIKTIGDSVMAAFTSPDHALQAALAVQHSIKHFNDKRTPESGVILVKIGLHTGSAIAVNLNNTLDYFGNMVNLAARIQSKSRSEEILMSEEVHRDPNVQHLLSSDHALVVTDSIFDLHGIGETRLFSVMVNEPSISST